MIEYDHRLNNLRMDCEQSKELTWVGVVWNIYAMENYNNNNNDDFSYLVIGSSNKFLSLKPLETWLLSGKFKKPDGLIELPW